MLRLEASLVPLLADQASPTGHEWRNYGNSSYRRWAHPLFDLSAALSVLEAEAQRREDCRATESGEVLRMRRPNSIKVSKRSESNKRGLIIS